MKPESPNPINRPGATARKGITFSSQELVRESSLGGTELPRVVQPAVEGLSLPQWAAGNVDWIKERLSRVGAILFRGFNTPSVVEFEEFLTTVAGELLDYSYRSTPRAGERQDLHLDRVSGASEHPAA